MLTAVQFRRIAARVSFTWRAAALAGVFLFPALVQAISATVVAPVREVASVLIPAGVYRPLSRATTDPETVAVAAFRLDALPVTNAQFLAFLATHPQWRRSRVSPLFADETYLRNWADDLDPGPASPPDSPVVNVSWFAARAYARAAGLRLPTLAEWEVAAAAGYTTPVGRAEPDFVQDLFAWLARPVPAVLPSVATAKPNVYGARGLHGLVWEWVDDFNTAMVIGESRTDAARDQNLFCGGAAAGVADTSDYAAFMRQALRSSLKAKQGTTSLGFRCASDLPSTDLPTP